MSLNYWLAIAGSAPRETLAAKLCRVPHYRRTAEGISAPGLDVRISESGKIQIELIDEELGFKPTTDIRFRVDKKLDPAVVHRHVLQGCMALLDGATGDAVLLFNSETIILLRRNGELLLNPVEGFWTDEVRAIIPTPYKFEKMRTL